MPRLPSTANKENVSSGPRSEPQGVDPSLVNTLEVSPLADDSGQAVGLSDRRPPRTNEVAVPLSGDEFSYMLEQDLDAGRCMVPAGTIVTARIDEARMLRWIPDNGGFWAFEVRPFLDIRSRWVVATPRPNVWREIKLDA